MSTLDQLLHISSYPLITQPAPDGDPALERFGSLGAESYALLVLRNGFYAFESALHVFPHGSRNGVLDLSTWNALETWRQEYGDLASECLFFAEDAVGSQFCLKGDRVCTFDRETGALAKIASSLEEWAARLLADFGQLTAHPLAHDWQLANGAIPPGCRLGSRTPLVLGGAFEVGNMYAANQVELMRFNGALATRLRDLPDGERVRLKVTD